MFYWLAVSEQFIINNYCMFMTSYFLSLGKPVATKTLGSGKTHLQAIVLAVKCNIVAFFVYFIVMVKHEDKCNVKHVNTTHGQIQENALNRKLPFSLRIPSPVPNN